MHSTSYEKIHVIDCSRDHSSARHALCFSSLHNARSRLCSASPRSRNSFAARCLCLPFLLFSCFVLFSSAPPVFVPGPAGWADAAGPTDGPVPYSPLPLADDGRVYGSVSVCVCVCCECTSTSFSSIFNRAATDRVKTADLGRASGAFRVCRGYGHYTYEVRNAFVRR